jgi:hypothetical protein
MAGSLFGVLIVTVLLMLGIGVVGAIMFGNSDAK